MKEFVLIFRTSNNGDAKPSPEQLRERIDWLKNIAAQGKLADKGSPLSASNAKIVMPGNVVADGPYMKSREFVSGYMVVKAASIEEAIDLAKGNPIFKIGGNVEVRAVVTPGDNS